MINTFLLYNVLCNTNNFEIDILTRTKDPKTFYYSEGNSGPGSDDNGVVLHVPNFQHPIILYQFKDTLFLWALNTLQRIQTAYLTPSRDAMWIFKLLK